MITHPDGEGIMFASQPYRYRAQAGKNPGDRVPGWPDDTPPHLGTQRTQEWFELFKLAGDKDQSLFNVSLL
jgi:hypothetical protein